MQLKYFKKSIDYVDPENLKNFLQDILLGIRYNKEDLHNKFVNNFSTDYKLISKYPSSKESKREKF